MSWYRTGTVAVTNGSKTVTGVGTLWTTAVNVGDAFALVDANLNPTGAWYEVDAVVSNTELTLKQSYAGTTGSNKQYCVFNLVGNMTTPSFAQRLATFFASFQSLIDKPTTTPTASSIPVADSGGKIADGWIPATVARLASPALTGSPTAPTQTASDNSTKIATTKFVKDQGYFNKANILGTVSQSGGIPTGAVIERGSNANGEYVKFADGTMFCSRAEGPSLNNYVSGDYTLGVTLPSSFVDTNYSISLLLTSNSSANTKRVSSLAASRPASSTTSAFSVYLSVSDTIGANSYIPYIAIGRWF